MMLTACTHSAAALSLASSRLLARQGATRPLLQRGSAAAGRPAPLARSRRPLAPSALALPHLAARAVVAFTLFYASMNVSGAHMSSCRLAWCPHRAAL